MVNALQQSSNYYDENFYRNVPRERLNTISQAIKTELENLFKES
jgi:hypothetical protein